MSSHPTDVQGEAHARGHLIQGLVEQQGRNLSNDKGASYHIKPNQNMPSLA